MRTKKHEKWSKVFPLGDISSSKDSCEIFKGTIKENLSKGINDIINGYVKFTIGDDGKWMCSIINECNIQYNPFDDIIIIVPFVVGDYKFYSQMLGKEGYDSHWCPHCKLYRTEWQKGCVYTIDEWELTSIKAQHQSNLATKAKGVDKRGVCEEPYFDIPVSNFIPPVLHIKLGEVNKIVAYLNDFADTEVQHIPQQQHDLRRHVIEMEMKIKLAMEEKRYWDSDNDDAGKEIVKRAKAMLKQLDKEPSQSEDERASLEHQIEIENTRKNSVKASLKAMRLTKTSKV